MVVVLDVPPKERDRVDDSDSAGDSQRCSCLVGAREWTDGRLGGVDTVFDMLLVR